MCGGGSAAHHSIGKLNLSSKGNESCESKHTITTQGGDFAETDTLKNLRINMASPQI